MKKRQLRKSDIKELNRKIESLYGKESLLDRNGKIEVAKGEHMLILSEDLPVLFYVDDTPVPTLRQCLKDCFLKRVTVDMGAVKFVTGGADIMRPGIVGFDDGISADELVCIVDETHGKPLAIGRMLVSGEDARKADSGRVIRNLHYVGDKVWNS